MVEYNIWMNPDFFLFPQLCAPHMGLDGKTPADLAGIKIEGENKWLTLIQNASKNSRISSRHSDETRPDP